MTYTRSTCGGDSRKIDQHSTRSILRCGNVGTITCQCASERRQCCHRRPRRGPINPRSGEDAVAGSTSAPSASEGLIVVQPPSQ
ncbi:hypothetical protein Goarm_000422, partial [Gossypium armourianum]|nr:hypothetical protein [Gossypium armourianum]